MPTLPQTLFLLFGLVLTWIYFACFFLISPYLKE
jgi:hypothetical protein